MRTLLLTGALIVGAAIAPATPWGDAGLVPGAASVVAVDDQGTQSPAPQINVEVNRGGRAWYANPVWLAIGGVERDRFVLSSVPATGVGPRTVLHEGRALTPAAWGQAQLIVIESNPDDGSRSILAMTVDDERDSGHVARLIATPADEYAPALSPDGGWLAFVRDEPTGPKVYVQRNLALAADDPGAAQAITGSGCTEPVWAAGDAAAQRSGMAELFYRQGRDLMSVMIRLDEGARATDPRTVLRDAFAPPRPGPPPAMAQYDASPDGRSFVFVRRGEDSSRFDTVNVVLNFGAHVSQRLALTER